jgi:hypothetical protein
LKPGLELINLRMKEASFSFGHSDGRLKMEGPWSPSLIVCYHGEAAAAVTVVFPGLTSIFLVPNACKVRI